MKDAKALRIENGYRRGGKLNFRFDDADVTAFEGESIAAALMAAGIRSTRVSPGGHSRGPFCFMGSCQECAVRVDGRKVLACATPVTAGMVVHSDGKSS